MKKENPDTPRESPRGRSLGPGDNGRVFLRVDEYGTPDEFLYLDHVGPGSPQIASFVTFRVRDGAIQTVGDTGYVNGPWFEEVAGFSEALIAEVLRRHEKQFEEWRDSIRRSTEASKLHNKRLQARFGKPPSWTSAGDGPTKGKVSTEYVVWYDPDRFNYVIEVYGPSDALLASRTLECSAEPRFGMDVLDHERIFGEPGEVSQLIEQVENG